eukprot:scaffold194688_cov26-Tisochrysis_lutea.AAC.1
MAEPLAPPAANAAQRTASDYGMSQADQKHISDQLAALGDKVQALLERAQQEQGSQKNATLRRMRTADMTMDLTTLPAANSPLAIFIEVEGLAFTVEDTEELLLDATKAGALEAGDLAGRTSLERRRAALQTLSMSFSELLETLQNKGTRLQEEFVNFCEQCCIRRADVSICTRGFKDVVRQFLRTTGLGHIEVFANDVAVDHYGKWKPCFKDDSEYGHDKARSMRRALTTGASGAKVVLIGSSICDMVRWPPVLHAHAFASTA